MTYADLMIAVSLTRSNRAPCDAAIHLATRFGAGVIGVAVGRPIHVVLPDYPVPAGIFDEDRRQIDKALHAAETEFRSALEGKVKRLEWRACTTMAGLADHLVNEARSADLIIVLADRTAASIDSTRQVDLPSLVMQSAKPVLLIPSTSAKVTFNHILVAWKESREAQRAIAASLPLLKNATQVSLVSVAQKDELVAARNQTAEVALWLGHHGIQSHVKAVESHHTHARALDAIADELKADVIVAGAYGHNRQGQWVLGGVTSDLLLSSRRCSLLSP